MTAEFVAVLSAALPAWILLGLLGLAATLVVFLGKGGPR